MLYISNFLIKIYVCCCIIIRWSEPLLQHPIKKKKEVPHSPMKKSWRRNCGAQSLRWPWISKVANARKRAWCWVILEGKRRERCSSLTKSIWTKGTKKQSFSSNFSFIAILKMSVLPCWLLQSSRAWALEASLLMKWLDPLKLFLVSWWWCSMSWLWFRGQPQVLTTTSTTATVEEKFVQWKGAQEAGLARTATSKQALQPCMELLDKN